MCLCAFVCIHVSQVLVLVVFVLAPIPHVIAPLQHSLKHTFRTVSQMGSLDARYYDHLPLDRHLPNVAFVLAAHLNHPANAAIVGPLYTTAQGMGEGAVPLLKLLVQGLFQRQLYGARQRVARGAYAQVFRTQLAALQGTVALKAVDAPAAVHDRCVQVRWQTLGDAV